MKLTVSSNEGSANDTELLCSKNGTTRIKKRIVEEETYFAVKVNMADSSHLEQV